MATSKLSFTDLQNPLSLHPSDGPASINVPKLQGAGDYRSCKRSLRSSYQQRGSSVLLMGQFQEVQQMQWKQHNGIRVIIW